MSDGAKLKRDFAMMTAAVEAVSGYYLKNGTELMPNKLPRTHVRKYRPSFVKTTYLNAVWLSHVRYALLAKKKSISKDVRSYLEL